MSKSWTILRHVERGGDAPTAERVTKLLETVEALARREGYDGWELVFEDKLGFSTTRTGETINPNVWG